MKIAPVADVKAHFSEYVKESEKGPVVVTRNGRPAVVMIAAGDDSDELERLALWIDLNAIFYGVYLPEDQARQLRGELVGMPDIQ